MPTEAEFLADVATPRWIKDVLRFLPVKSQFILSGNIRDRYPFLLEAAQTAKPAVPAADGQPEQPAVPAQPPKYAPLALNASVTEALKLRGYQFFLEFNAVEGFGVLTPRGEFADVTRKFFADTFKLSFDNTGRAKCSLPKALETLDRVVAHKEHFIAVFLDFASRYVKRVTRSTAASMSFLARRWCSATARSRTSPRRTRSRSSTPSSGCATRRTTCPTGSCSTTRASAP